MRDEATANTGVLALIYSCREIALRFKANLPDVTFQPVSTLEMP